MSQLTAEDVEVGSTLPSVTRTFDAVQMFQFSAATLNSHRIHYDAAWATDVEGYPDLVVQGPLQAAALARVVTDWMGPSGRLLSFSSSNRAPGFRGQSLTLTGQVVAVRTTGDLVPAGHAVVELSLECRRDADLLMPGSALVALPVRPPARGHTP